MLKLDRIMEIAAEHAPSACSPGEVGASKHNVMMLSVAIQEALSENDELWKKNVRQLTAKRQSRQRSTSAKNTHG